YALYLHIELMRMFIYISTNCIYLCAIILHSRLFCLVIIAIASIVKVLAAIVLDSILFVVVRARTNYVHKKGLVVITAKGFHFVSYVNHICLICNFVLINNV